MPKTLRKMNINFAKCQHLPSIINTFFHEFQHLPSIIVIFLMEFQHLATIIAIFSRNFHIIPSQALSQPTQPASQPASQPPQPCVRVYETQLFIVKTMLFENHLQKRIVKVTLIDDHVIPTSENEH